MIRYKNVVLVGRSPQWLCCPKCKDEHGLHHEEPEWEPDHLSKGIYPTNDATIPFWCENCKGLYKLRFVQHKGSTWVGWEQYGERPEDTINGDYVIYPKPVEVK